MSEIRQNRPDGGQKPETVTGSHSNGSIIQVEIHNQLNFLNLKDYYEVQGENSKSS